MKKISLVLIISFSLMLLSCQQQGDVNNDGKITITDLVALRGRLEGKLNDDSLAYDINKDGIIDEADFTELKTILLK